MTALPNWSGRASANTPGRPRNARFRASSGNVTGPRLAACSEPVGFVTGRVEIEGDGIDSVTVVPSDGAEAITAGGGTYDTEKYDFEVTTKSVSVKLRETANVSFQGKKL